MSRHFTEKAKKRHNPYILGWEVWFIHFVASLSGRSGKIFEQNLFINLDGFGLRSTLTTPCIASCYVFGCHGVVYGQKLTSDIVYSKSWDKNESRLYVTMQHHKARKSSTILIYLSRDSQNGQCASPSMVIHLIFGILSKNGLTTKSRAVSTVPFTNRVDGRMRWRRSIIVQPSSIL